MSTNRTCLDDLVTAAYDAALDPALWPDLLARIADALGAAAASLLLADRRDPRAPDHDVVAVRFFSPADIQIYRDHFAGGDGRQRTLAAAAPGRVLADGHHLDFAEYRRSRTYNDFLAPLRLGQGMGATLLADPGRLATISLLRHGRDGAFDAAQIALVERLVPHLARALQVHARLVGAEIRQAAMADALDRFATAVFVLRPDARIVLMNRAADALLARPFAPLRASAGRLSAAAPHAADLLRLVAQAAAHPRRAAPPPILRLPARDGSGSIGLMAAPLAPAHRLGLDDQPLALLFAANPRLAPPADPAVLAALFALTVSEAEIAALLMQARPVAAIAARRGVTEATVRIQLKSVFHKTGTHSQAQLVALLARSVAALG